jgi:transposase
MRDELTDHEWFAVKPFLPNKPHTTPNARRDLVYAASAAGCL